jgi:hypothetical protein
MPWTWFGAMFDAGLWEAKTKQGEAGFRGVVHSAQLAAS